MKKAMTNKEVVKIMKRFEKVIINTPYELMCETIVSCRDYIKVLRKTGDINATQRLYLGYTLERARIYAEYYCSIYEREEHWNNDCMLKIQKIIKKKRG